MVQSLLDASVRVIPEIILTLTITGAYIWRQVTLHEWRLNGNDKTFNEFKAIFAEIRAELKELRSSRN